MNMQVKERRTKILLSLFLMPDNFFSAIELDQRLQKIFYFSLNYKTKGTLAGLLRSGLIEKKEEIPPEKPSRVSYSLTDKGFYQICLQFPFFRFVREEWDGTWRIISYEIPEKKRELRDRLRREMRGWGLGPWHRSFWLTPHPIMENLRDLVFGREEEGYIQAFESTHIFGSIDDLVEKVWQKSSLEKNYRDLFKQWYTILSSERSKLEKIAQIVGLYVEVLKGDPGLPKSLVGQKWIGFEAFRLFAEIKTILMK